MLLPTSLQSPAQFGIVSCQNFVIDIPEGLCKTNILAAWDVLNELRISALRISRIDEWKVNRFIICGHCSMSGIDPQEVEDLFKLAMAEVVDRICGYEEGGNELSEMKRKERQSRFYEKNKLAISEKRKQQRREKRVGSQQLAYG